jgi:phosphatidylserine/phosphatidylglycerophosphate/cardiolipin synthase-like enzyme
MIYSFTSDAIGDKIVEKFKGGNGIEGIEVKGIVEKKQNTADYSEYWTLTNAGIDVAYDTNPYNLHHKVFIVDDEIVITGSYNPTASGTNKNDENVLIIYNKEIAGRYVEEFEELISLSS